MENWRIRPTADFEERVRAVAADDAWIVDGNYTAAEPILRDRAELLLWVDLPFWITYPRVLQRTWQRLATRQELWSGNRESLRNILAKDGMPAYALLKHKRNQRRYLGYWERFDGLKRRLVRPGHVFEDALEACDSVGARQPRAEPTPARA